MRLRYTPTLGTSVNYSSGDAMGGAAVQLTLPPSFGIGGGKITSVHARDAANQGIGIKLLFFKSNPELAGTPATITDNAAFEYGTALTLEIAKLIIDASYWESSGTTPVMKTCFLSDIEGIAINPVEELWVLAIPAGTYNAAAADDLTFDIGMEPVN